MGSKTLFLPRVGSGIFKLELPPEQRRIWPSRTREWRLERERGRRESVSGWNGGEEEEEEEGDSEIYEIVEVVRSFVRSRFTGFSSGREFNDREWRN